MILKGIVRLSGSTLIVTSGESNDAHRTGNCARNLKGAVP
jgi:hypothetical protein